ncbi:MAG TPA: hypothetical protein VK436_02760 [Methanocella sp.]|nr:hypothetical protein [Methanocella sp.]
MSSLSTQAKLEKLQLILQDLERVLVAFSGGVDSTFLLQCAVDTLGPGRAIAVAAISLTLPTEDRDRAVELAHLIGVSHVLLPFDELENSDFAVNPRERCYFCKKARFATLKKVQNELGLRRIIDGANADDPGDFRPGMVARKNSASRARCWRRGYLKTRSGSSLKRPANIRRERIAPFPPGRSGCKMSLKNGSSPGSVAVYYDRRQARPYCRPSVPYLSFSPYLILFREQYPPRRRQLFALFTLCSARACPDRNT